jgi:hypothetical protein
MMRNRLQIATAVLLVGLALVCLIASRFVPHNDPGFIPIPLLREFMAFVAGVLCALAAWVWFAHRTAVRRSGLILMFGVVVFSAGQALLTAGRDWQDRRTYDSVAPQVDALAVQHWEALKQTQPTGQDARNLYDDYVAAYGAVQDTDEVFTEADREFRARWFLYVNVLGGVEQSDLNPFAPNRVDCAAVKDAFPNEVAASPAVFNAACL